LRDLDNLSPEAQDLLSEEKQLLEDLLAELDAQIQAEADGWRDKHSDVLGLTVDTVTESDRDAVLDALHDLDNLSPGAQDLLQNERELLESLLGAINTQAYTYFVSGVVVDEDGNPVVGATVSIDTGNGVFTTQTDANGRFVIDGLADGVYNLVVAYDGRILTLFVAVSGYHVTLMRIVIPDLIRNSIVEIGENTPHVVIDGLDLVALDDSHLTAEEMATIQAGGSANVVININQQESVKEITLQQGREIGLILSISITLSVYDVNGVLISNRRISQLNNPIAIHVPLLHLAGRTNFAVHRTHNGFVGIITTTANSSGERIAISECGDFLIIYARYFSTFSIEFDSIDEEVLHARCFIHWILLALILAYILITVLLTLVYKRTNKLAHFITWGAYVLGIIVLAFFVHWHALCIIFFVIAIVVALIELIYWLFFATNWSFFATNEEKIKAEQEERDAIKAEIDRLEAQLEAQKDELEAKAFAKKLSEEEVDRLEEELLAKIAAEKKEAAEKQAQLAETEAAKAEEERIKARETYLAEETARIQSQRAALAKENATFKLSREDVLDYIDEMVANSYDYPVAPNARLRINDKSADSLKVGSWVFAVMYENHAGVIKFIARMNKAYAESLQQEHPTIVASTYSSGDDWYKVIIDTTFYSKQEVFTMIDNWYAYTFKKYRYNPITKKHETNWVAARLDEETTAIEMAKAAVEKDFDVEEVEKEHNKIQSLLLAGLNFELTKKEISRFVKQQFEEDVEISERDNAHISGIALANTMFTPRGISDNGKKKRVCYAFVYQLKNNSIKLIVKLPKVYAERQAKIHTNMCRSKFPAGKNWYVTIIDSSYKSADEVYAILERAKTFVESNEKREDLGQKNEKIQPNKKRVIFL